MIVAQSITKNGMAFDPSRPGCALSGTEGARLLAIAFAIVAGSALLLGFVGLALLAIDGPRQAHQRVNAATQTAPA